MDYILSTLPSGLRVLTVPMDDRQSASVALWVQVGSRHESRQNAGVSHLIEHMLFKGTKHRSARQIKESIEGVGGLLNAYTSDDLTCYFAKLLWPYVPLAIEVFSDMVRHATLDSTALEKEKTVVVEEIKMYRDLPSQYVFEMMSHLLWPNQALGRPISGTPKSVSCMKRSELRNYIQKHYRPQNMLLAVSGPVQHKDIVREANKWFPSKKSQGRRSSFKKTQIGQRKPLFSFIEKQMEQTHFVIGFHGISRYHRDRYKLGLLNILLGGNMSSRLFEEVREKRGLAYEIRSGTAYYSDTGAFLVSAGVETKKVLTTISVVLRELEKLCRKPISVQELKRAQDYFMSQLYMGIEDTLDHLLWAGERTLDSRELPNCDKIREKIEAVTVEEIQSVAKKLFRTNNLNLALIGPVSEKVQHKIKKSFSFRKS